MKKINCFILIILFLTWMLFTDNFYKINPDIDVINYQFSIKVNEKNNKIEGKSTIRIKNLKNALSAFSLDLHGPDDGNTGMLVSEVSNKGYEISYKQKENKLYLKFKKAIPANRTLEITIKYTGIPQKGLIIKKNNYGIKTFLGDNWPDKAHYWLPCIDHPSDKASCEFIILAPSHYQVVATGIIKETRDLPDNYRLTHWIEKSPVATKVMMICLSHFAVNHQEIIEGIPVQTWVFPEERDEGFADFSITGNVLRFFSKIIGTFSYSKIASVQAPTNYGGLENAGAISYYQNVVKKKGKPVSLIAHEMAHQWFGDSVTEKDWDHVWLSEGFATYFTTLYREFNIDKGELKSGMKRSRERVIKFYEKNKTSSVVDYKIKSLRGILNTNTYQKGSWTLHMLRRKLGDELFIKGIRKYYKKYKNRNASTTDFKICMEKVSSLNLTPFFQQWVYGPGLPELKGIWKYNKAKSEITIKLNQIQKNKSFFDIPIEIGIQYPGQNKLEKIKVYLKKRRMVLKKKIGGRPEAVILDPEVWLLMKLVSFTRG